MKSKQKASVNPIPARATPQSDNATRRIEQDFFRVMNAVADEVLSDGDSVLAAANKLANDFLVNHAQYFPRAHVGEDYTGTREQLPEMLDKIERFLMGDIALGVRERVKLAYDLKFAVASRIHAAAEFYVALGFLLGTRAASNDSNQKLNVLWSAELGRHDGIDLEHPARQGHCQIQEFRMIDD